LTHAISGIIIDPTVCYNKIEEIFSFKLMLNPEIWVVPENKYSFISHQNIRENVIPDMLVQVVDRSQVRFINYS
jgi:isoprenylcysteine carboxyl methyltransferase (ICMT) family protein YpbQ